MAVTEVDYLYRDASNYKVHGSFRVLGEFSLNDLHANLQDGEFFVPERLGIPPLRPVRTNEDDHLLHEFVGCRLVDAADYLMTARELVRRVRDANRSGWFVASDSDCMFR